MSELAPNGREKVAVPLWRKDGHVITILRRCREAMHRAEWSPEEIDRFTEEAMRYDFEYALQTVRAYTNNPVEEN